MLVAIAIIGTLASSAFFAINPAGQFAKAHDAQRKNDLEQIRNALDIYYSDNNQYPNGSGGLIAGIAWGNPWPPYMAKISKDPLSPSQNYLYESPIDGDVGAYRLYAKLERCADSKSMPGVDCSQDYSYSINSSNLAMMPTSTPTPLPTPTPTPWPVKKVFITATAYNGDLKTAGSGSDGLDGADKICQLKASTAGLPGTYKAWLSSGSVSAKDRLTHGQSAYKRMDGITVANNWNDLTDGSLLNSINRNEYGNLQSGSLPTWTNTKIDGALVSANSCNNWTNGTAGYSAGNGFGALTSSSWTHSVSISCDYLRRVYCFEQ